MKNFVLATSVALLLCVTSATPSRAGIIDLAILLVSFIDIPAATPGSSASFSNTDFNGAAAAPGATSRAFNGSAAASAAVDIDRFSDASASASATWHARYRVNDPLNTFILTASYGVTAHAFSHFNADSSGDAAATVKINGANFLVSAPVAQSCSTSVFGTCTHNKSNAGAGNFIFPLLPVGTIIEISGVVSASASADTGAGSGDGSGSAFAKWTLKDTPEPSGIALLGLGLLGLLSAVARRRTSRTS